MKFSINLGWKHAESSMCLVTLLEKAKQKKLGITPPEKVIQIDLTPIRTKLLQHIISSRQLTFSEIKIFVHTINQNVTDEMINNMLDRLIAGFMISKHDDMYVHISHDSDSDSDSDDEKESDEKKTVEEPKETTSHLTLAQQIVNTIMTFDTESASKDSNETVLEVDKGRSNSIDSQLESKLTIQSDIKIITEQSSPHINFSSRVETIKFFENGASTTLSGINEYLESKGIHLTQSQLSYLCDDLIETDIITCQNGVYSYVDDVPQELPIELSPIHLENEEYDAELAISPSKQSEHDTPKKTFITEQHEEEEQVITKQTIADDSWENLDVDNVVSKVIYKPSNEVDQNSQKPQYKTFNSGVKSSHKGKPKKPKSYIVEEDEEDEEPPIKMKKPQYSLIGKKDKNVSQKYSEMDDFDKKTQSYTNNRKTKWGNI
jgi:hypothetical protein